MRPVPPDKTHLVAARGLNRHSVTVRVSAPANEGLRQAAEIGPIAMVSGGRVRPPQGQRYTSFARLQAATTLDEAFLSAEVHP